jgi:hypothetical protein
VPCGRKYPRSASSISRWRASWMRSHSGCQNPPGAVGGDSALCPVKIELLTGAATHGVTCVRGCARAVAARESRLPRGEEEHGHPAVGVHPGRRRRGGFNRAASVLYVSQPSLSQAVRALERDVGTELFHRIGRRAVLTEAGRALIEPARAAVRSLEVARASVAAAHELREGRLDIAAMPSQAVEPLTTLIRSFAERYPGGEQRFVLVSPPGAPSPAARRGVRGADGSTADRGTTRDGDAGRGQCFDADAPAVDLPTPFRWLRGRGRGVQWGAQT